MKLLKTIIRVVLAITVFLILMFLYEKGLNTPLVEGKEVLYVLWGQV